ncbi:MAG: VCBS repeat-containing protein, partial [Anaerolineales bacterium]|nr:VCBS repeat-containing protein [Anaerolineales bacterium]
MENKKYFIFLCLFVFVGLLLPGVRVYSEDAPELTPEDGLTYLYATQNVDGSWGGSATALNGLFPSSSIVVQALRDLEATATSNQQNGIQYLAGEATDLTPFLAQRILALAGSGQDVSADVAALLARQNLDGGWGTLPGVESNVWDTAVTLTALKAGGVSDTALFSRSLAYLIYTINPDGGWGLMRGDDSHIFYTALALATLNAHDATFALTGMQNRVVTYMHGQQGVDGGYGEPESTPFETALVLHAILQTGLPVTAAEQDAIAYLDGQQQANGSWVDDPYSTALALRALAVPPDSDGDGMSDACETTYGLDPHDPTDALPDNDGDGLPNRRECELGTNPNLPDTDNDTVDDGTEVSCASDPLDNGVFNRPPLILSQPVKAVAAGQGYLYGVTAVDPDSDPLTYNLLSAPTGMTIDATGLISWTAGISQTGRFPVVVAANDGGCDGVQPFGLDVLAQGVDLLVTAVNPDALDIDPTTLVAAGPVAVGVQNRGGSAVNGRFDIILFEDLDGDALYSSADQLLGSRTYSGTLQSDEAVTLTIPAAGVMQFRDNLVYALVDSRAEIPELDENNNITHSGQRSQYQPVRDWLPVVEWMWNAPSTEYLGGAHPPTVAPLIDTNGDGLINERDVPAVIMVTNSIFGNGRLQALRGDTGEVIFNIPTPGGGFSHSGHTPAVGDLDGDGLPEIAIVGFATLYVFNNDGTLKWQAAPGASNSTNVALADLEGDGQAEVIANVRIFNADGTLRATANHPGASYWDGYGGGRHVADLDMDGDGEILAGPSAYDKDGNIVWYWRYNFQVGDQYRFQYSLDGGQTISTTLLSAPFGDGWTAVANVDDDPYPEIILVDHFYNTLVIFEHDGQVHAGPWKLYSNVVNTVSYELGGTAVADFDGDGQVEIALSVNRTVFNNTFADPSNITLLLYETDGTLAWEKAMFYEKVVNLSPVPTAFDFDGDGAYEILLLDRQRFTIVDGATS